MNKKVSLSDLAPVIEETLSSGGSIRLEITGQSMLPLLREGRDSVELIKACGRLKKYDIPLYRREDGTFVLHRVIGVRRRGYVMCGDHQCIKEYPVTDGQIIGVVSSFRRDGKDIDTKDASYMKYARRRVRSRVFRRVRGLFAAAGRVFFGKK